jgi:hypothetical protein
MAAKKTDLEAEVWNAISAFEQILEAMPNDRASLEALSNAYQQIGDHTKAKEYVIRLGRVIVEERDISSAKETADLLQTLAQDDPEAAALMKQLRALSEGGSVPLAGAATQGGKAEKTLTAAAAGAVQKAAAPQVRMSFNMSEELTMAWNLLEAKELTQEEYAAVVQDLTEMSAGDSAATISVLHVMEARAFKGIERIMGYLARECATPFVSLAFFELTLQTCSIIPPDFIVRRGAMVFELVGKDAMAVVMNPYDKQLRKDVEALAGRRCHFYMTMPAEFDQAAKKIADMLADKAANDKKLQGG